MSCHYRKASLRNIVASMCFGIAALSILQGLTASARAQAEHPVQAARILGVRYEQIESVLGKPGVQWGAEAEHGELLPGCAFFKAPGVLRLVTAPGTTGDLKGLVEFQFSRGRVKDWQTAARIIGLDPGSAKSVHGHLEWRELKGWSAAWNPKSFSGPRDPAANALVFVGPEMGAPLGDPDVKSAEFREKFLH